MTTLAIFTLIGFRPKPLRSGQLNHHPDPHFINVDSPDWKRRLPVHAAWTMRERTAKDCVVSSAVVVQEYPAQCARSHQIVNIDARRRS